MVVLLVSYKTEQVPHKLYKNLTLLFLSPFVCTAVLGMHLFVSGDFWLLAGRYQGDPFPYPTLLFMSAEETSKETKNGER